MSCRRSIPKETSPTRQNDNFFGLETFTYTVSDGNGGESEERLVTINVLGVDDAPEAVNDTAIANEDEAVTINVLGNDIELDGDSLTITILDGPSSEMGEVEIVDGQIVYTPGENFSGVDTFTYQIEDNTVAGLSSDPATVTVFVGGIEDGTVYGDVFLSDILEDDGPLMFTEDDLVSGSNNFDGLPLSALNVSVPASAGSLTSDGSGNYTFTPNENFNGPVEITFDISVDGEDPVAEGTGLGAHFNVLPVNDGPDLTVPEGPVSVVEGGKYFLSEWISVDDIDINEGETPGTLTLTIEVPDGLSFVFGGDETTDGLSEDGSTLVLEGSLADVLVDMSTIQICVDDVDPGSEETFDFGLISVIADDNGGTGLDNGENPVEATIQLVGTDSAPTISVTPIEGDEGDEIEDFDNSIPEGTNFWIRLEDLMDDGDDPVTQAVIFWGDGTETTLIDPMFPVDVSHYYDDDVDMDVDAITVTLFSEGNTIGFEGAGSLLLDVTDVAPGGTLALSGTFAEGSDDVEATITSLMDPSSDDFGSLTVSYDFNSDDTIDLADQDPSAVIQIPSEFLVAPGITVTAYLTDNDGVTTELSEFVAISNSAPEVVNEIEDVEVDEDAGDMDIDLSGVFSDTAPLTYSAVSADGSLVGVSVSGSTLTLDFQDDANGDTTVTVTASDGDLTVSDTFTVTVNPVNDAPVVDNPID